MAVKFIRKNYVATPGIPPKLAPVSNPNLANNPPVPLRSPEFLPHTTKKEMTGINIGIGVSIAILLIVAGIFIMKKLNSRR